MSETKRPDIIDLLLYAVANSDHISTLRKQWLVVYTPAKVYRINPGVSIIIDEYYLEFESIRRYIGNWCVDYTCDHLPDEHALCHSFFVIDYVSHLQDMHISAM